MYAIEGMLLGYLLQGVTDTQVGRVVPVSRAHFLLHDIMSLIVSSVLACLVCLLCVFLVPAESGEFLL